MSSTTLSMCAFFRLLHGSIPSPKTVTQLSKSKSNTVRCQRHTQETTALFPKNTRRPAFPSRTITRSNGTIPYPKIPVPLPLREEPSNKPASRGVASWRDVLDISVFLHLLASTSLEGICTLSPPQPLHETAPGPDQCRPRLWQMRCWGQQPKVAL
jgi:hypothetical protein